MAEHLGGGRRTIQRHLSELEAAGYIETRMLGLGRPNEYIIKSLRDRQFAGAPKMAHLVRHERRTKSANSGAPLRVVDSDVDDNTLSHRGNGEALADAFFAAIGEAKPARARRERALGIVNDLTAEGFTEEAIREACRLAGERGARGPDLLPHLIGEAHERTEVRTAQATRRRQIADEGEAQLSLDEASLRATLAAVEALPAADRERLEAECRAALPVKVSEGMAAAVLPGMMAARLREQA
jgi:DNA-binding transcriptional MerR regulator